jgi:hypothetical protein
MLNQYKSDRAHSHDKTECILISPLPPQLQDLPGIFKATVTCDPAVGPETVLILNDPSPFLRELETLHPFTLNLNTNVMTTEYGAILVLVFWMPAPGTPSVPFAAYEHYVNISNPSHIDGYIPFTRLNEIRLFLCDGRNTTKSHVFPNVWKDDLTELFQQARGIAHIYPCGNFDAAKASIQKYYTTQDLIGE